MKRLFTLSVFVLLYLGGTEARAQFAQNFEDLEQFAGTCWSVEGFYETTDPKQVLSGTSSAYTLPPVNGSTDSRVISTPYLNIVSSAFTVSFNYKLSNTLSGLSVRTIKIMLESQTGAITQLDLLRFDKNTPNQTVKNVYNKTFNVTPGTRKLVLEFSGSIGDGNNRFILDDLASSAGFTYNTPGGCNSAPVAANDVYTAVGIGPYTGSSVLLNDQEPNNEPLTITLLTKPVGGKLTLNTNGTFTFVPEAGFQGSFVTFSYSINDNGYFPLSSVATVQINFVKAWLLPLALSHFTGTLKDGAAAFSWTVAENEGGSYFEVQKSTDGHSFVTAARIAVTAKPGTAEYHFTDAKEAGVYYRLQMVNRDQTVAYSKVIMVQGSAAGPEGKLVLGQNPVQGTLHFSFGSRQVETADIAIYNMAGGMVYRRQWTCLAGNNTVRLHLNGRLVPGLYLLAVRTAQGRQAVQFLQQ